MRLNIEQRKLVQSKPAGHSLIRGLAGSGKTTVVVNRIPFLLENYCLDDEDEGLQQLFANNANELIKK